MNERFRELAEQAVREVDNVDLDSPLQEELSKMYIPDCFAEKFAELIVGECIDTVLDSSVEYTTRPRIVEEIKEHFGVK